MRVTDTLKDYADACEDKSDGAAATKQGYADNHVGGKDGMVGREKPSNRNLFRNANNIVSPPGPTVPPFTKHARLPQELCTVLAMAALAINDQPVALRSRTRDDLVPLTMNQLLSGNIAGVPLEPQAKMDQV